MQEKEVTIVQNHNKFATILLFIILRDGNNEGKIN